MKQMVVYISSPYSLGSQADNVRVQLDRAHRILDYGHVPYAPLLSHFLHIYRARPYADWLRMDTAIIPRCDVLLRLPGESKGADAEVDHAVSHAIHVCYGWQDLERWLEKNED